MEMRYVQDMNKHLLTVKQTVLSRFAECIVRRISNMESEEVDDMEANQIVSAPF